MAIVAIIPARFGSTRLPGKPLSDIHGRSMIEHVHERVMLARLVDRVLVATDDERILAAVRGFGGEAVMTSAAHATGTDRLAEAVLATNASVVVNVQGDEPMLDPAGIDAALEPLLREPDLQMSTLSLPLTGVEDMLALYFSRSPIPYLRLNAGSDPRAAAQAAIARGLARRHVGLYVYRRDALLRLASLSASPLEQAEGLEQLRALHHGIRIRVVPIQGEGGQAVDTLEDLERVRRLMAAHN